uniref:WAP domain-containing protein n=1 Tax=Sinocyclocheilus grahami TaxID=75366 RepID=A0A672L7G9_SINGR
WRMTARVYCLLIAVLSCLFGYLSVTDATRTTGEKILGGYCPAKLMVVPSRRGCSSDGNCSGGHKCCQFDCGPVCVPPVSPGECPPQSSGRRSCTRSCRSASNCPNNKKCCSNGCGRYCTAPYAVKPGQCPDPKNIPLCAESRFHYGLCPGCGQGNGGGCGCGNGRGCGH